MQFWNSGKNLEFDLASPVLEKDLKIIKLSEKYGKGLRSEGGFILLFYFW